MRTVLLVLVVLRIIGYMNWPDHVTGLALIALAALFVLARERGSHG